MSVFTDLLSNISDFVNKVEQEVEQFNTVDKDELLSKAKWLANQLEAEVATENGTGQHEAQPNADTEVPAPGVTPEGSTVGPQPTPVEESNVNVGGVPEGQPVASTPPEAPTGPSEAPKDPEPAPNDGTAVVPPAATPEAPVAPVAPEAPAPAEGNVVNDQPQQSDGSGVQTSSDLM